MTRPKRDKFCVVALDPSTEQWTLAYGEFRSRQAAEAWACLEPAIQAGYKVVKLVEPALLNPGGVDIG